MNKDKKILDLVECIRREMDLSSLEFPDYWDGDLCAIGIKRHERVAYISGESEGKYGDAGYSNDSFYLSFEVVNLDDVSEYKTVKEMDGITTADVIRELRLFMQV